MKNVTLFSWGYHGWGTATTHLVKLVDSIEKNRGYEPPMFVDIRIRRAGRAPGFVGSAFEELLGDRYRWMKSLGNRNVRTGESGIVIDQPEAATELLDLAIAREKRKQRVIFFCNCSRPKSDGEPRCHRSVVSNLLLAIARDRKILVSVMEWSGGQRRNVEIPVNREVFKAIAAGRKTIPVPDGVDAVTLDGPPWATVATFRCGDDTIRRVIGNALWKKGRLHLPVVHSSTEPPESAADCQRESDRLCLSEGWSLQSSGYEGR